MIPRLAATLVFCVHTKNWDNNSIGQECVNRSKNISKIVYCAKKPSQTHWHPQVSSNHCPFTCQVWDDITLDFIERLPASQGKDTIMVVVDRLSKSAHFLPLKHLFTAKSVAEKFMEGIIKLHGMSFCEPFLTGVLQDVRYKITAQLRVSPANRWPN